MTYRKHFISKHIWNVQSRVDWKPCEWWTAKPLTGFPQKSTGYIKVDCYGGLNQMRRDLCDGVDIARLLNATLVLPDFEAASYWNDTSGFADIFDVDYFIQRTKDFVHVVKELPKELASKKPVRVDCRKQKGHFDYIESVLPSLTKHQYIVITPAASQTPDRHPVFAKAARCHVCFKALRLVPAIQKMGAELLQKIPQPILSLHMRFEPDMIAYSRCQYNDLSQSSLDAINSARNGRTIISGDAAVTWRKRGKCPLTPRETAFILQALGIPTNTTVYLAAGESLLESKDFTSIYRNSYTKSSLLDKASLMAMRGNSRAALDYYVSINSDAYIGTYFGNMDKMVAAMRALNGQSKTLFLNRRAFAEAILKGLEGEKLAEYLWETHSKALVDGRGSALPDCFCMSNLTNSS
ncbi:O-fucosyltransferase 13 isoform X2 [Cryptomeria japonica]|nr:O-fucosyltransferase 13 isoform X2 [Cryptomeria japonica]